MAVDAVDGDAFEDVTGEATPESSLAEDYTLQGSPQATATNAALRAMSRTARSFLIYDSHNAAIRQFLGEYERTMRAALAFGPIALGVRPFDLVLEGALDNEVVYVQRERSKSLAFRMYRDGVRRITIDPAAEWNELLRLLEILSIRYTGVRQHEDDIVTLLWKAGFQHIEALSVEGFVLAGGDDDSENDKQMGGARQSGGASVEVPLDFDRPAPQLASGSVGDLGWRTLDDAEIEPLHSEVSSRAVGTMALALCRDMLRLAGDPRSPTPFDEVRGLLDEVRTLLLADGQMERLLELARAVAALDNIDPDLLNDDLRRFVDSRALGRILHSASRGEGELPDELGQLLDLVPGDHLESLLRAMSKHRAPGSRVLAARLIEREVERSPQQVARLVSSVEPEIGASLMTALANLAPERVVQTIEEVIALDVPEYQLVILRVLKDVDPEVLPPGTVLEWLRSPVENTRVELIHRIGRTGSSGHYMGLKRHLDKLKGNARAEAIALGQAMADVAPDRTLEELGGLVRPRTFLGRMRGSTVSGIAVWAGVSALGRLPGEYPETAIRWQMERASEALYNHCQKTLHERRVSGARGASERIAEGSVYLSRGLVYHPGDIVLSEQMLCFVSSSKVDRWFGLSNIDLPVRSIERVEVDDGVPSMTIYTAKAQMRFVRGDVVEIGTSLLTLIGGSGVQGGRGA
ncbi:MAG: hypothetical protein CL927_18070 [Deltaproteobacteria bacterium]|nr:hypothetical protein [Deltaproteobacteria bacterium]HCH66205.1 hypothetical protein [Deltaproteobacteria bacterium]